MFSSTLGIPERTLTDWLKDLPKENVGKENRVRGHKEIDTNYLKQWLLNIPCIDSHYCRKTPSYQGKRFIDPSTKIMALYNRYCNDAQQAGRIVLCLTLFRTKFRELGLSIFIPRKDQCNVCIAHKLGNTDQETHNKHIKNKTKAQNEKESDNTKASGDLTTSVWTMDTQAVITCPRTKACALYFRSKLQVHNLTFFEKASKKGYCFFWDETQGELKAENFMSIQYLHFKQILDTNRDIKTLIIWSDSCGYQNKNCTLSSMYLQLSIEYKVDIIQKYLHVGHTQMECDSMHSCIERNMKHCDLYKPADLRVLMSTARRTPFPYTVKQLFYSDFF